MAIQTQTYKQRVRKDSRLSRDALLVALVIADLRYDRKRAHDQPLSISLTDLAAECHMHKNTLRRYLDECIKSRWILARAVYRDGRQQPNEYFVADPTNEAEYTRMYSVTASEGQILDTCVWTKSSMRLDPVLRSKYRSEDAAPPKGGRVPSDRDEPNPPADQPAEPSPELVTAGPPPEGVPAPNADDETPATPEQAAAHATALRQTLGLTTRTDRAHRRWNRDDAYLADEAAAPRTVKELTSA